MKYRSMAWVVACLLLFFAARPGQAQEFDCEVRVDFSQLSGAHFTYLEELEEFVEEYINDNTWTQDRFEDNERIRCDMQIIFQEAITQTSFNARLILTMDRPIFGTTSTSTILRISDANWQFSYVQGAPLTPEVERYDPFTSVIDYYLYIMLGYDYDTFSELGGTEHFRKARRIVELAQGQNALGWAEVGNDRSRDKLVTQLLDPRYQSLRRAYFQYHFGGLDHFVTRTDDARLTVMEVVTTMQTLYQEVSRQYTIDLFFNTKYQELTAIFDNSSLSSQAYAVLQDVDPGHLTEYSKLVQ